MDQGSTWRSDEVLAWTEHDGPGRAPTGAGRAVWFVLAGVLAIVFAGMVFTDTLCPEHRAWVKTLGAMALLGSATAIVGLIRGWAAAPVITLLTAGCGVAIGIIDMAHDPSGGRLIATAFALTIVGAGFLCVRQLLFRHWEHGAVGADARMTTRIAPADAADVAEPIARVDDRRPVAAHETR